MNETKHRAPTGSARLAAVLLRLWPILLILLVLGVVFSQGWHEALTIENLRQQRADLRAAVVGNPVLAIGLYFLAYAVVTACMVPGAGILTISGGFLFGLLPGTALTTISATCGATGLFLAARTGLGDFLAARAGPFMKKLEAGFAENAVSYMLLLRFVPVVPFPVANIAPALFGARVRDFVLTTLFGIIPGVLAYSWIGAGLGAIFDRGEMPDLAGFARDLAPAFIALAVVALIPVAINAYRKRRRSAGSVKPGGVRNNEG